MELLRKSSRRYFFERMIAYFLTCGMFFNMSLSIVLAGPEGAQVVNGQVSFQQSGCNTTITASHKAIINYSSFDIARPEVVKFVQPGSSATVLNRILSANPTNINGTLLANGRVFFVNPAGIYIGEGARINVNQLVASALNITNSDFINGRFNFAGGNGSVINDGNISAEKVYLIGKEIANSGSIHCPDGYVVMAAGDRVFLGEPGSDVMVEIDPQNLSEPADLADSGPGVLNQGEVDAAGDRIVLASGDIHSQAISNVGSLAASVEIGNAGQVSNTGTIEARSDTARGGTVIAKAAEVTNSGTVDVTGSEGGEVAMEATGRLGQFGIIHADGTAGDGGNIELRADDVVAISSDSMTTANAGTHGEGGDVIAFSPDTALFREDAQIEAKGGSESGNGGFVEVSGKEHVEVFGLADVSANNGSGGTFFIDPHNVTIQAREPGDLTTNPFTATADGDTVSDNAIEGVINTGGSAVVQTSDGGLEDGDIIQDVDATIDFTGAGGDASLTLNAADDIELNGGIAVTGATASLTVAINANGAYGTASGAGDVDINANIATNGGSFTSSGVDFANTDGEITAGNVDIDITGSFTCGPGSRITAGGDGTHLDIKAAEITLNAGDVDRGTLTNTGTGTITLNAYGDIFLADHSINVDEGNLNIDSANIRTSPLDEPMVSPPQRAENNSNIMAAAGIGGEIKADGVVSLTAGAVGDRENPLDLDGASALEITATGAGDILIVESSSTIKSTDINVDETVGARVYIDYAEKADNDDAIAIQVSFDGSHYLGELDLDNDSDSSFSYTAKSGDIILGAGKRPVNMGENGDVTLSTSDDIVFPDWWGEGPLIMTAGGSVSLTADAIYSYTDNGSYSSAPLGIQGATAVTLTDTGPGPIELAEVGGSTIGSTSITVGNIDYGTIDIVYDNERGWVDIDDDHFINSVVLPFSFSYTATKGDINIGSIEVTSESPGEVEIIAGGAIRDAEDDSLKPGLDVVGATINLKAGEEGIGSSVSFTDDDIDENRILEVMANRELNADTSADGGHILINGGHILINSRGDLPIGSVNAGTGNVILNSTGAITEAVDDPEAVDIRAESVQLSAATAITGNSPIEISASSITAKTNEGDINIDNDNTLPTTASLEVTTGAGSISFSQAGGGNLTARKATTQDGSIHIDVDNTDLWAGKVTAGGDDVDDNVELINTTSGNVMVDNITALSNQITINSAGTIKESINDRDVDLTAASLSLTAKDGIGVHSTGGNSDTIKIPVPIETTAASIVARTEDNDKSSSHICLNIQNTESTSLEASTVGTGSCIVFGRVDGGELNLETLQTNDGSITVRAGGDVKIGSVTALNNQITIDSDGTIRESVIDPDLDLTAASLSLTAGEGIGIHRLAGNSLDIKIPSPIETTAASIAARTEDNTKSSAHIYINIQNNESTLLKASTVGKGSSIVFRQVDGGELILKALQTNDGSITVRTDGDVKIGSVTAFDNQITIHSTGAIDDAAVDAVTDLTANTLMLTAYDGIGATTEIETDVSSLEAHSSTFDIVIVEKDTTSLDRITLIDVDTVNGRINITVEAAGGATGDTVLTAVDADGDGDEDEVIIKTAAGDIIVGVVSADDVSLEAKQGSVNDDSDDSDIDIKASVLTLTASDGIGGNPMAGKMVDGLGAVETHVESLEAHSNNSGDIVIKELDNVTLGDIKAINGNIDLEARNGAMTHQADKTITAGGGSLAMKQADPLDLKDFKFEFQMNTELTLESFNGSVTAVDEANGGKNENAADQWRSIKATAQSGITLKGSGGITTNALTSTNGDIVLESTTGAVVMNDTVKTNEGGGVTITAQDDVTTQVVTTEAQAVTINSNIEVHSLGGDLRINDNLTANGGGVFLIADNGMITTGDATAKTGIKLEGLGNITTQALTTITDNISVHSTGGDLILGGAINAYGGHEWGFSDEPSGGGVELIADNGKITSDGDTLNVAITGYSDDVTHRQDPMPDSFGFVSPGETGVMLPSETGVMLLDGTGVVLPDESGKAAIVIRSQDNLKLGSSATLTAKGTYKAVDAPEDKGVDDRDSVNCLGGPPETDRTGDPIDVAIYVSSYDLDSQEGGNVTVDCPVLIDRGGTMVIDAENTVNDFGYAFKNSTAWNSGTNGLEVVSRTTQTLDEAVKHGTLPHAKEVRQGKQPTWFGDSKYVLRGKRLAEVLTNVEPAPVNSDGEKWPWKHESTEEEGPEEPPPVTYTHDGEIERAVPDMLLQHGGKIETSAHATAFIEFPDGSVIIMKPETCITIESPGIFVWFGEVIAIIRGRFKINTDNYVMTAAEDTILRQRVDKNGEMIAKVIQGRLVLESKTNLWFPLEIRGGKKVTTYWPSVRSSTEMMPQVERERERESIPKSNRSEESRKDIREIMHILNADAVLFDLYDLSKQQR